MPEAALNNKITGGDFREARMREWSGAGSDVEAGASRAGAFAEAKSIARRAKRDDEMDATGEGGGASEKTAKLVSSRLLDFLWGLLATVAGAIIAFVALNFIAFLKMIGGMKFIKFRGRDTIGIIAMDLMVLCAIFIALVPIIILSLIAEDPLKAADIFGFSFIWDAVKGLFSVAASK